jgi:hypothetical protein
MMMVHSFKNVVKAGARNCFQRDEPVAAPSGAVVIDTLVKCRMCLEGD